MAHMGEERKVYKVLMEKPEGKRPLRTPRCRWEDGITIHLREIGWEGVEWIHPAQGRNQWQAGMYTVMNLQVLAPQS
jgi:hypothetical protein